MNESSVRYEFLDGLRGLAAIAVVLYHFGTRAGAPFIVPHGYLAVDFFFILSGFVLAHSYTQRDDNLTLLDFIVIRAKRFLPVSLLGLAIGLAYLLFRSHLRPEQYDSFQNILVSSALNSLLIPKPWDSLPTFHGELFPADDVLWSLSLEMIVNIVWFAWFRRARLATIVAICAMGGLTLVYYMRITGNANVGSEWETYCGGLGRAIFGFFAGVLIWRVRPNLRASVVLPTLVMPILLASMFWEMDYYLYDAFVIFMLFPSIIYFSSKVIILYFKSFFVTLGKLSYPLYAIHFPILMIFSGTIKALHFQEKFRYSTYLLLIPIIALSLLIEHFYEEPIRRRLRPAKR